ncbi:protamine-like [Musca autumnalis]|uniref:protamine-like n=1 Tax=Musca autumnalis TaxID=221902 RepID=UPI003CFBAEDE
MSCRVVCSGEEGGSSSGGKFIRPGPLTRSGYLNYLREYRQKHCGLTAVETVRQGAKAWNNLSQEEKNRYKQMGSSITSRSASLRRNARSRSGRRSLSARRRSVRRSNR